MPHCLLGPEGNWGCIYPDGRVPLPALRRLLVGGLLRFGLEGFVLLLRHFHNSFLRLLQLCPLLGRALPSPTHLQNQQRSNECKPIWSDFHLLFEIKDLMIIVCKQYACAFIILSPPSSWSLRFLFLHNMRHPQWATSSWAGRLHHLTPKTQIITQNLTFSPLLYTYCHKHK